MATARELISHVSSKSFLRGAVALAAWLLCAATLPATAARAILNPAGAAVLVAFVAGINPRAASLSWRLIITGAGLYSVVDLLAVADVAPPAWKAGFAGAYILVAAGFAARRRVVPLPEPVQTKGVLLVDDQAEVRRLLRRLLAREPDIDIREASDGADAIELARDVPPDLIVLDLSMPGMSGVAAIRPLAEACPNSRILVLSNHHEMRDEVAAIGAHAFLPKDESPNRLVKVTRELLGTGISKGAAAPMYA